MRWPVTLDLDDADPVTYIEDEPLRVVVSLERIRPEQLEELATLIRQQERQRTDRLFGMPA